MAYLPSNSVAISATTSVLGKLLLWAPFGSHSNLPSTPVRLTLVSTSGEDSKTGDVTSSGAVRLLLTGVGPGFEAQKEEVVLEGTVPVSTTLVWFRVNCVTILKGSFARGTIRAFFTHNDKDVSLATIEPVEYRSYLPVYACPAGYSLLLMSAHVSFSSFDQADRVVLEGINGDGNSARFPLAQAFASSAPYNRTFPFGKLIRGGQDLLISGTRVANITNINVEVEGVLVANNLP